MLVHREHLLGLFVSLLTFYRKGALFSIPFGFYWIINTPAIILLLVILLISNFFHLYAIRMDILVFYVVATIFIAFTGAGHIIKKSQ